MDVFSYDSYRLCLRDAIDARKTFNRSTSYARLADSVGIKRSYLSSAIHGRADLNADQLFNLCERLNMSRSESDYLLLLREIEKCQVPKRRSQLEEQRHKIKEEELKSEKHLGRKEIAPTDLNYTEYFSTPWCPTVHMFLTVPKYADRLDLIAERLRISRDEVNHALGVLERCRLLRLTGTGIELLSEFLHVPSDSYLSRVYATAFRLKAIEYQQQRTNEEDYFFTSSFSASVALRREIKSKFLEFLQWLGPKVESAPPDDVFHVNFDLFRL